MMDAQQLESLRQRLNEERERLTANQDEMQVGQSDEELEDFGATNHPADAATDMFLRERNITLNENTNDIVAEIDAALERIDNGTYGICERTGEPIAVERLEALPYARYSIEGQRLVEQESGL